MGDSLKGKVTARVASHGDWRRVQVHKPGEMDKPTLKGLHCPFPIIPEPEAYIPTEYITNLAYIEAGERDAPWRGYYAQHNGHKLVVANYAGVWFEICQHNSR
jgi:hypothetical protein